MQLGASETRNKESNSEWRDFEFRALLVVHCNDSSLQLLPVFTKAGNESHTRHPRHGGGQTRSPWPPYLSNRLSDAVLFQWPDCDVSGGSYQESSSVWSRSQKIRGMQKRACSDGARDSFSSRALFFLTAKNATFLQLPRP
eukprot:6280442-Amphidinium_carterae.2